MNPLNHIKELWGREIIIKLAIALAMSFTCPRSCFNHDPFMIGSSLRPLEILIL